MIILLARKFIDVDASSKAIGLAGEYNLRVRSADGKLLRETGWFPNLILDAGLNRWGTGGIITGAAIGTGTAAPAASDTALQAFSSFTTTSGTGNGVQTVEASSPYYTSRTFVFRTALGALNGNYSEIGVGWGSTSLFSRALILNGSAVPTAITVLSTEQLDIVYRLRLYPPIVDTSTDIVLDGVTYTVTGRASNVTALGISNGWGFYPEYAIQLGSVFNPQNQNHVVYNGAIGAITANPSGSPAQVASSGTDSNAYSNNSLTRTGVVYCGLTDGNLAGGIRSYRVGWSIGCFQYDFGTSIPKDAAKTLAINYSISWARRA